MVFAGVLALALTAAGLSLATAGRDSSLKASAVNGQTVQSIEPQRAADDSPVVLAADEAMDLAIATGSPVEVLSQRESAAEIFAHPDGTWERRQWLAPKWVLTEGDGSRESDWRVMDLTLDAGADGSLAPAAYPGELSLLPADGAGDVLVSWAIPGTEVLLDLLAPVSPMPQAIVEGARARYVGIVPGVDLVIDVLPSGYETYFVIHDRESLEAGAASLISHYRVTGGSIKEGATGLEILDLTGAVVGFIPQPFGWDASQDPLTGTPVLAPWAVHGENPAVVLGDQVAETVPVDWLVDLNGASAAVTLLAPQAWLDDPATAFPVVIDPAPETPYFGWDMDANLHSPNSQNSAAIELRIGSVPGGTNHYVSYLGIDTSYIKTLDVTSAVLHLWNHWSATCSPVGWYAHWTVAPTSASTYNNYPAWREGPVSSSLTFGYNSNCAANWATVDITSFARAWTSDPSSSQGILLEDVDGNSAQWKRFYSANYQVAYYRPHISIYYNQKPNTPTGLAYAAPTSPSARGELSAVVTDPDGTYTQVRAMFTAERRPIGSGDDDWELMFDQSEGSYVDNGGVSTRKLDLIGGYEYRFRAYGNDSRVSSAAPTAWSAIVTVPSVSDFDDFPTTGDSSMGPLSLVAARFPGGRDDA
jgi:hypothetical protein